MIRRALFLKPWRDTAVSLQKLPMHTLEQILVGSNTESPTLALHKLSVFAYRGPGTSLILKESPIDVTQTRPLFRVANLNR